MKRCAFASAVVVIGLMIAPAVGAQTPAPANPPQKTVEEITVFGVQDKIIRDFVYSQAAPVNSLVGGLARWEKGICPAIKGLSPEFNAFIIARVKEVAAQVGAKVEAEARCKTNVQIVITPRPQVLMDAVRQKAAWLLGSHYKAQQEDLATVRHPIQAWYVTATADNKGNLRVDDIGNLSDGCRLVVPVELTATISTVPIEINAGSCDGVRGSRTSDGWRSEFNVVTVLVDINNIGETEIGPIADYIAMLALAQVNSSDACQAVPSISNLFSPDCDSGRKAKALTAYDLAYLRGLYQMDTTLSARLQKINLANWMKRSLDNQ